MYCKGSKSTLPNSLDVRAKCIISSPASEKQMQEFDNFIKEFGHRIDDIFFLKNDIYQINIICDKLQHASACIVDDNLSDTNMSIQRFINIIDKYSKTFRDTSDQQQCSENENTLSLIQSVFSIKSRL